MFELLDRDESNNVISVKYKGLWIAVDNGYLTRAETMPPIKREAVNPDLRAKACACAHKAHTYTCTLSHTCTALGWVQ